MKESEKEPIYKRPLDLAIFLFPHILLCPFWLLLWAIIPALICLEDGLSFIFKGVWEKVEGYLRPLNFAP